MKNFCTSTIHMQFLKYYWLEFDWIHGCGTYRRKFIHGLSTADFYKAFENRLMIKG